VRARRLALLVRPPRDRARALRVVRQFHGIKPLRELAGAFDVTRMPSFDVHRMREEVALLCVAGRVREDEIMAKIGA
jgi:hypothetical protein